MKKYFRLTDFNTRLGQPYVSNLKDSPCYESVNFKAENGILQDGFSIAYAKFLDDKKIKLPEGECVVNMSSARTLSGDKLFVITQNTPDNAYYLYIADINLPEEGLKREDVLFAEKPNINTIVTDGYGVAVITDGNGVMYRHDGAQLTSENCPVGSLQLGEFCGRLYAITSGSIIFAPLGDPDSFPYDYSNQIKEFPAEIYAKKAVLFGDELIIAGARGIVKVTASPLGEQFSVRTVAVGCERLLPETLAADSQFAYVLSDAGLGYYNFFSMEFKHRELGAHFTQGICGFICNGEYHAVIKAPQNVNKSIVFSFGNSNYHMSDTSVVCDCLSVGGESVLVACKNVGYICCVGNGYISPAMKRIFATPITNFGVADKKTLTAIWLYTNKTVLLSVCADGVTRLYKVTGGKGKRIIRPYISGEQFSFTIKAEGSGICISALGVEMEY